MFNIKKEIIINANPEKVWNSFSKIEEWPQLSKFILKVYWNTSKKWTLDSSFTQVIVNIVPFMKTVSRIKFKEIIPMEKVTWTGNRSLIKGIHTLKFEKINLNKTKVSNIEHFEGPLAPIIFPLIKKNFETYFEQFLLGLKRKAEK